jgi:hypothetical protein
MNRFLRPIVLLLLPLCLCYFENLERMADGKDDLRVQS